MTKKEYIKMCKIYAAINCNMSILFVDGGIDWDTPRKYFPKGLRFTLEGMKDVLDDVSAMIIDYESKHEES